MLFEASTVYAPDQPHGDAPYSRYQNVNVLGRYHLGKLSAPNIVIGLAVLLALAYYLHRRGRRR